MAAKKHAIWQFIINVSTNEKKTLIEMKTCKRLLLITTNLEESLLKNGGIICSTLVLQYKKICLKSGF